MHSTETVSAVDNAGKPASPAINNRVLFTTVCRPIGASSGDAPSVGYELLHGQVTRAQGIFSPRATHHAYGLDFIAENISAPVTVLHYPSKSEFIKELKTGNYGYVGLSFILATFHHLKKMSALVRKYSPKSKIILGGYGTVMPQEYLAQYGDYICKEEGVGYMRRLLGEPPLTTIFKHPTLVSKLSVFSKRVSSTGMIFAGLGCPNGCDFCCTSHFFKRQHIRLLKTGAQVYGVVQKHLKINPEAQFTILDEEFLLNRERALEFRDLAVCALLDKLSDRVAAVQQLALFAVDESDGRFGGDDSLQAGRIRSLRGGLRLCRRRWRGYLGLAGSGVVEVGGRHRRPPWGLARTARTRCGSFARCPDWWPANATAIRGYRRRSCRIRAGLSQRVGQSPPVGRATATIAR